MTARMVNKLIAAAAVVALVILTGCGGDCDGADRAVAPLPTAWPRVAVCDSVYRVVPGLPVHIEANAGAHVTVKDGANPGVDIAYPQYGATVYLTVVHGLSGREAFARAWQGRRDRIDANTGDANADIQPVAGTHYRGALVVTHSASQTPVQLLVGDDAAGVIVSATAFIHAPVTAPVVDSIAPVVDALAADLRHLTTALN